MAPAATSAVPRPGPSKLHKPAKVRYFKGKPLGAELDDAEAGSSDDDDDSDAGREEIVLSRPRPGQRAGMRAQGKEDADGDVVAGGAGRVWRGHQKGQEVKVELAGVKVGRAMPVKKEEEESEGDEESEEESEEEVEPAAKPPLPKPPGEESSEYETDSEEESSEEEVKKPAFRPVFVKKDQRGMTQEKAAAEAEEKARLEEELREKRKNDSKEIAGETIRRELLEKEAGDIQPDVDDTDGLDPSAEFTAWRARELSRLLREKQAQAARDAEQEEIERRRALPEEQRLREDMEFAQGTRDKEKTQMGFLQKYYHKGAFFSEDNLLQRDYTGATESAVDMTLLPKVMQVRDYGKASRTKYTHLADQDTSQGGWGNAAKLPASMGMGGGPGLGDIGTTQTGCWNCGGPHLRSACPNQNINDPLVRMGITPGGGPPGGPSQYKGFGGGGRDEGYGNRAGRDSGYGGSRTGGMAGGDSGYSGRPQDSGYSGRSGAAQGSSRNDGGPGRAEYRGGGGDRGGRGEYRHRGDARDDRNGGASRWDRDDGRGYERERDSRDVRREARGGSRERGRREDGGRGGQGGRDGHEYRRREEDGRRRDDDRRRDRDRDRDRDRERERDDRRDKRRD